VGVVAFLTRFVDGAKVKEPPGSPVDEDSTGCGWPVCWNVRMNREDHLPSMGNVSTKKLRLDLFYRLVDAVFSWHCVS